MLPIHAMHAVYNINDTTDVCVGGFLQCTFVVKVLNLYILVCKYTIIFHLGKKMLQKQWHFWQSLLLHIYDITVLWEIIVLIAY